jgi:magnesium transporter
MENSPIGFVVAIVISVIISVLSLLVFRHKRLI